MTDKIKTTAYIKIYNGQDLDAVIEAADAYAYSTEMKKHNAYMHVTCEFMDDDDARHTLTQFTAVVEKVLGRKILALRETAAEYQDEVGYREFLAEQRAGNVPDEENPAFMFSQLSADMLRLIVDGDLDVVQYARYELRARRLS